VDIFTFNNLVCHPNGITQIEGVGKKILKEICGRKREEVKGFEKSA
jgi:hypothetical protein